MTYTIKNECGDCTLCCKMLHVELLNKPAGQWCRHCTKGSMCRIYQTRPRECANFQCLWLSSNWPQELRPDKTHVVFVGGDGKLVEMHTEYPQGEWWEKYHHVINELARRGFILYVVHVKPKGG